MPRVEVPEHGTFVDFPDGTPPEEMQSVLATQFPKKRSILDSVVKGPLARVAQGVNSSLGGALSAFGLDEGAKSYQEGAEYWKQKADAAGSSGIPAQIYEGLGSAPMGVAEFVAGVPYAAAKGAVAGYREDGVTGALKEGALEAVKRAGIGKVFHGIGNANLTPLQRTGAMAGTMGAQTAAEGGSLPDVVAATATGALLMPPSGGGAQSVVRSRLQRAGATPEVAADLSGRFNPDIQPAGTGSINTNNVDTVYPADTARPPAIRDSETIALTGNESRPSVTRGPVLDSENASRISPYDATGPAPGISIEVARLKQEHPYWSDAEYLKEAVKTTLTQNPETLPAATDMSTVRPAVPQPIRQSEDAPGLRRGVPIGDQEMGQRFSTVDRISDPVPPSSMLLNPEVLPARTDFDRYEAPAPPAERPAENAPSRTVEPQSMENGTVPAPTSAGGRLEEGLVKLKAISNEYNTVPPRYSKEYVDVEPEIRHAVNAWKDLKLTPDVRKIPLSEIRTTQDWADTDRVAGIMKEWQSKGVQPARGKNSIPEVYAWNGDLYAYDGNHRVIAADLLGLKDIEATYANLTPDVPVRSMPSPESFNHDSLPTAAVTAADSLVLQDAAPQLKVAVVGTPAEIKALGKQPSGKTTWVSGDKAYIIDVAAAREKYGSVLETKRALKAGDPEALGYPERPADVPLQTAAVTKAGEILTEPEAIKQAATVGDVAYAAEGAPAELAAKIDPVAEALRPASKMPPNSIVTQVNGLDGRPLGYEVTPHDGTPKGMHDAALKNARAMNNYNEASNAETIHLVTGPNGDPTNRINARFGELEPVGRVDLHAGIHLPTLVKQGKDLWKHYMEKLPSDAPAGSLKAGFDANRRANEKFGQEPLRNKLKRALIDSSANVQEALMRHGSAGEHVRRQFDAISGASAKAQLAVEKQREALSGMSLREQQAMGDMVAIDRDLAITKPGYTKIFGKTDAELRAARQTFQQDYKLTDAEMARVENATRQYFDAWKQNTQRMLDAGLIDATQKQALDAQDYSPKQFLEKIDPDSQAFSSIGGGRVSVPDSGIKRLKEGSDSYFRNNPMRLLSEATARIETRIARNEANQELAKLPSGNGIVEVVKPGTPAPSGYEALTYMENGKQKTIHMKSEYAKEWRQNDPLINSELVNWLQWLSGAKLVRAGATGYNPAFLVTNVPRDLVTMWMQAGKQGYSPHAPVALAEMAGDLAKVAGDAWKRKGRYVDYVNQGGGRELLTHEGALSSRRENLAPAVAKVQKVLSYVNEFSEVVTRLAYRERMIKNGMDPASASKAAGEYVDFSRGGSVAKAVDRMGIPYLNAAIQGTRSMARAAGRDPGAFAYKTAQLMTGAAGLYALNQMTNPDGLANVSDREKADNFIIMLPKAFEYTDKDGTTVSPYLKVSKEQSMRPFATAAELFTQWANGGKPTKQQLEMALGSAVPISVDKMPPAAAAFWTYVLNADTYRKEPVWKGKQEIEPYAEYTNNTNPIYTAIGKATTTPDAEGVMRGGLSPERLKAGVEKIIPASNAYLQGVGNVLTDAYEKMNPSDRVEFSKTNYEQLRAIPGISRLLGGAKDTEQFREGIRDARTGTATQQFEVNKTLDAMVLRYVKTGKNDPALYDRITNFVESQSGESRARLENRIEGLVETADLPDRGWWMSVRALQPEDRADQFKARLKSATPDEQQRMLEIADGLSGFVSDRFLDQYEREEN